MIKFNIQVLKLYLLMLADNRFNSSGSGKSSWF